MPSFGACSIGGVTFHVLLTSDYLPLPVTEVIEEITHIPYSNINIVDSGGLGISRWQGSVKVASGDRAAFEALQGTTGVTFVLYGVTMGPARMTITSATVFAASADTFYRYDVDIIY